MGLAAQVFLRIRPPNTNPPPKGVNYFTDSVGNTLTLSGTGFLLKGNALVKKTHYYNKVYEQEDPFPETQIDIVRPLTVKFLSGYNTSLIFFGSTGSGKTHLIEGALNSFADDIFSDEVSKLKTSNFKLRFQTFEVYGELIKDLLQKQSDGLQVENEINQGVIVPKSDFMEFNNKESLKETLKKVFANKSSLRDKNLGEKCCIIYKFLLEVEPNSQQYTKFTWVESFGCEKLLEDPTKLTLKEGPFVSKTINAMKSLLSSCSSLMGQHFNFEQSILTELLFDEFGGNCLTSFVVNLNQSHSPVLNFQLLDIFSNLKNLILYPVKINLHLSTLLSFYRVREKKIHENLLLNAEKLKDNTKNVTANEILSTLVSVNQKNSRLLEESEKLKARLNDLSTRYDAIVLSKSNLEKTLTQNEEQNLIFKKALLDSQIDNEKLVDQSDNQNYDLTNKVMQLQNEIMETNLHMETLNEENFNLKAEIRDLKTENSSVAMEINILRENYFQLEKEHKSSLRKLDELGIELVNLVNTKTILINEKEGRLKEIEKIQKHNSFLQQRLESQEHHGYEVNTELQTLKSCSENTRSEFYLEKQKLENKNLEMEKEKLNLEKQLVEKTKAADEELAETKTYFQKTIKEQELEFNFKLKNLKKIELENNVLQKELEISNAVNSERNHIEFKLKERISQIEEQIVNMTSNYRSKLERFIKEIMEMTEFRKNPAKSEDLDLKELKILVDNMFQEILQSYIVHERHCTKEILLINEECKILKNQTERYKAELQNKKKTIINDESKVDSSEVKNADVNQDDICNNKKCKENNYYYLKKLLKEFMLNSQEAMEMERTKLLLRCNIAETEVTELHNYINLLKSRGDSR